MRETEAERLLEGIEGVRLAVALVEEPEEVGLVAPGPRMADRTSLPAQEEKDLNVAPTLPGARSLSAPPPIHCPPRWT
jgi:hypothetical protein